MHQKYLMLRKIRIFSPYFSSLTCLLYYRHSILGRVAHTGQSVALTGYSVLLQAFHTLPHFVSFQMQVKLHELQERLSSEEAQKKDLETKMVEKERLQKVRP